MLRFGTKQACILPCAGRLLEVALAKVVTCISSSAVFDFIGVLTCSVSTLSSGRLVAVVGLNPLRMLDIRRMLSHMALRMSCSYGDEHFRLRPYWVCPSKRKSGSSPICLLDSAAIGAVVCVESLSMSLSFSHRGGLPLQPGSLTRGSHGSVIALLNCNGKFVLSFPLSSFQTC